MSRPAQVQQMAKRAEEIQAELAGEKDITTPEVVQPPVPEPVEPEVVQPATVLKEEYDRLEQRYRTLQGMLSAEGNRSRNESTAKDNAIRALESRIIELETAKASKPAAPAKYLTEDDHREFGDTIETMRRAAKEEAEAVAASREEALLKRISELESNFYNVQSTIVPRVEEITQQREQQIVRDFWGTLSAQVPDWESINKDANFVAWLEEEDQTTGANRQQFLTYARNNFDAPRVIRIFNEWKRVAAGGQTPAPKPRAQKELESQLAPPTSKGTSAVQQSEAKTWTGADISQFYKDVYTGKYRGRAEEQKKIETDIFLAQKDGRYKP